MSTPTTRLVQLCNGDRLPLSLAAARLGLLVSYQEGEHDGEWNPLYLLRELCLGRPLAPEQLRDLRAEQLVTPAGEPIDGLRAVVLSAVRGEGRALRLDSPFTDPLDRAMADYLIARHFIRAHLDEPEATAFLADDPVQTALDHARRATGPGGWADRESDRPPPPPNSPPL